MLIGLRSRKHIAPFDLVRPTSIDTCLRFLSQAPRVALMSGGLDLIDRMKSGEVFDTVVSLSGIPDLKGIREDSGTIVVGAFTTHAAFSQNCGVLEKLPDLAKLWREFANPRVRQSGTIGGNLMSGLPHYDVMPALLALGATATIAEPMTGLRSVSLSELPGCRALLVNIKIPSLGARLVADRSLRPSVSVYAGAQIASGKVTELRVAIGCAYPGPQVIALPEMSQASLGSCAAALADMTVRAAPEPLADGLASAGYRRRMIEVLTRRSLVRLGSLL